MQRFLFRVEYVYPDGSHTYEPVCVRADDDDTTSAYADVEDATNRWKALGRATRTITLVAVTADV